MQCKEKLYMNGAPLLELYLVRSTASTAYHCNALQYMVHNEYEVLYHRYMWKHYINCIFMKM